MKDILKYAVFMSFAVVATLGFMYGMWNLSRYMNYSMSYEDMVRDTVCELVKPEYLQQPCEAK